MDNDEICYVFRRLAIEAGLKIMNIYDQNNFEIPTLNKKINDDPTLYVILDKWILLSIFLSSIFFIKAY